MDLIADIGATNTRVALLDDLERITGAASFVNAEHASLESVLTGFLRDQHTGDPPRRTALAVAAPLSGDAVTMTNIGWRFSRTALAAALGTRELRLLNDFEALALALPRLGPADCQSVGAGTAVPGAALAVLGPGSGLGVATAVPDGSRWIAVGGEGGHVSLPALNDEEVAVIAAHGDASGHCSAERLLSGSGLVRIHACLAQREGRSTDVTEPGTITTAARAGEPLALRTFEVFFALLGTVAGNLALTVGARGGVYIGGGIVPRVPEIFAQSQFRERFVAKGRYREYLDAIPTAIITCATPAFIGLKASLSQR
jgi:glucokinase